MSAGNYGKLCGLCISGALVCSATGDRIDIPLEKRCRECGFHLSRLREQAAIAAMQRLLEKYDSRISTPQEMAKYAIGYADALIDALKGGK